MVHFTTRVPPVLTYKEAMAEREIERYRDVLAGRYKLYRWAIRGEAESFIDVPYPYDSEQAKGILPSDVMLEARLRNGEEIYQGPVTMEQALGQLMVNRMLLDNDAYKAKKASIEQTFRCRPSNIQTVETSEEFL